MGVGEGEVARGQPQVFLSFVQARSLTCLELTKQVWLTGHQPPGICPPTACLTLGIQSCLHAWCFHTGSGDQTQNLTHVASTLLDHLSTHTLRPGACHLISFSLALGDRTFHPLPLTCSDSAGAVASGKTRSQTLC